MDPELYSPIFFQHSGCGPKQLIQFHGFFLELCYLNTLVTFFKKMYWKRFALEHREHAAHDTSS